MRLRLVIPSTLQSDVLHHVHTSLEGGHQGILRTFEKIRKQFYWKGLYRDVLKYVSECEDCETGKGKPNMISGSPGNLVGHFPFQIIAMDHMPSLIKATQNC